MPARVLLRTSIAAQLQATTCSLRLGRTVPAVASPFHSTAWSGRLGSRPTSRCSAPRFLVCTMSPTAPEVALKGIIDAQCTDYAKALGTKQGPAFEAWWSKYFKDDDVVMIRPSGNPLTKEMLSQMIKSPDVNFGEQSVVSVDSVLVFADGKAAVTTHVEDQHFNYQGTENADRVKISITWELIDDGWKIVHYHRATGQPIPELN